MNCFYHPHNSAVAICKNCLRGICAQCAMEMENGVACKGKCEERVKLIIDLMDKQISVYKKTSKVFQRNAIILGLLAFLFLSAGILTELHERWSGVIYLGMGLVTALGSLFSFYNKRQYNENS